MLFVAKKVEYQIIAWVMLLFAAHISKPLHAAEVILSYNGKSEAAQPLPKPPVFKQDPAFKTAEHQKPVATPQVAPQQKTTPPTATKLNIRRLAPPSNKSFQDNLTPSQASDRATLPFSSPQMQSLGTAGAGLAIVVGLFLLCAWMLRRGGPQTNFRLAQRGSCRF